MEAFQYWKGGIVYYGGIVGGAIGFFAYRWFYPFPIRPYLDAIAPSIALGTFFGRLGCFLNGCCYGDQCRLPWAVSFPAESPAWWHQVKAGLPLRGRELTRCRSTRPSSTRPSTAWSSWSC